MFVELPEVRSGRSYALSGGSLVVGCISEFKGKKTQSEGQLESLQTGFVAASDLVRPHAHAGRPSSGASPSLSAPEPGAGPFYRALWFPLCCSRGSLCCSRVRERAKVRSQVQSRYLFADLCGLSLIRRVALSRVGVEAFGECHQSLTPRVVPLPCAKQS